MDAWWAGNASDNAYASDDAYADDPVLDVAPAPDESVEVFNIPRGLSAFAAAATAILCILGIAGNALTAAALWRSPRVRASAAAAAFVASLCAADLLFCACVLPFAVARFAAGGAWRHGPVLCQLLPTLRYANVGVSLLSIAMITVNRYVMIAHPAACARAYRPLPLGLMVAFCWVFAFGMQLPTLLGVWGKFDFDPKLGTCSIMEDERGNSSKTALFVIGFLTPCAVIVCCYARIFWVVHMSERRLRRHASGRTAAALSAAAAAAAGGGAGAAAGALGGKAQRHEQREQRARRNEWRVTKMVLAIFLSFVVCYLPITVVKVYDKKVRFPGLHVLGYLMLYLSACINPVIYVIMNKQYRQAYKSVITFRRPSRWTLTPAPTSSGVNDSPYRIRPVFNREKKIVRSQSLTLEEKNQKSREMVSRTMMSQVSLALSPIPLRDDNDP